MAETCSGTTLQQCVAVHLFIKRKKLLMKPLIYFIDGFVNILILLTRHHAPESNQILEAMTLGYSAGTIWNML